MNIDVNKAKSSWDTAGLTAQGIAAVDSWIEKLAANIAAGGGRWDAFAKFAFFSGADPVGSVKLLKDATEQTSR